MARLQKTIDGLFVLIGILIGSAVMFALIYDPDVSAKMKATKQGMIVPKGPDGQPDWSRAQTFEEAIQDAYEYGRAEALKEIR